mmetsp:Transcript_53254/g.159444  ORF Transcript_53254/g.159444 Transcript_53254/m.159444 type:complete len:425 (+) Transcript_53254:138-1412(+)
MSDEDFPDLDPSAEGLTALPTAKGKRRRKKKGPTTFKKAPQAPKRFKSSYIFFSMAKVSPTAAHSTRLTLSLIRVFTFSFPWFAKNVSHNVFYLKMEDMKKSGVKVTNNSTHIAEMWKNLPDLERKKWDEIAKKDKVRFMAEKALYTGPWQVPSKRKKKDPSAPKRPMSAFLFFSQGKRQELKEQNPDLKNTEISTRLGEMWKQLSDEDRQPFIDTEAREREKYKKEMAAWRSQRVSEEQAEKERKKAIVDDFIKSGFVPGSGAPPVAITSTAGQGTAAMAPPAPPPMAAGMVPFPPHMMLPPGMPSPGMPPVPMPHMPMTLPVPHNFDSSQKSTGKSQNQQEEEQSSRDGPEQPNQPFYPGYYYPMYPYPYPMPMTAPVVPLYPSATAQLQPQPDVGVAGIGTASASASAESTSETGDQGETV